MHIFQVVPLALALLPVLSFAFPSHLHSVGRRDSIWKGLHAIAQDQSLVELIQRIHADQQAELQTWKNAGGVVDFWGNATRVVSKRDTSGDPYEGLKRFPEDDHPFIAPRSTDQRGPCPGMNTLANHGYISRTGIVTVAEVINAVGYVFNMGVDTATLLTVGALVDNGDIPTLTFSIGGADSRTNSLGLVGGLLGTETGLDGHGRFNEGDCSVTRCDFYICDGDNHNMQPSLFSQLIATASQSDSIDQSNPDNLFNVPAMAHHFHNRYENSRTTNPNFYFLPPSALVTMGATYFYPGFFSNGTIGNGGVANLASISSFAGARQKDDGSWIYVPERIPEQGWYRRGFAMNLVEVATGALSIYTNPAPVSFGGNAGSTSSFVGIGDVQLNSATDLGCLLYNALYANFFGEFQNILFGSEVVVNAVLALAGPALSSIASLGCPTNFPDQSQPNIYPNMSDPSSYGGAVGMLQQGNALPGSGATQPCLGGNVGSGLCRTQTNTYDELN